MQDLGARFDYNGAPVTESFGEKNNYFPKSHVMIFTIFGIRQFIDVWVKHEAQK